MVQDQLFVNHIYQYLRIQLPLNIDYKLYEDLLFQNQLNLEKFELNCLLQTTNQDHEHILIYQARKTNKIDF